MVIASSSATVQGADCAGGVGPTAFGDAFFGKAMRASDDLAHAFDVARKQLVEQRAAEPMMSVGPAIAEHLKSLRSKSSGRVVAQTRLR